MKKNLEIKISELKTEISNLKEELSDKKIELQEAEEELRTLTRMENTNDTILGDSLFFKDEDGLVIETMLVSDSRGNLDLVMLTDCSDMSDALKRGCKLNKRFFHIDSLIKDVEDYYDWEFLSDTN